MITLDRDSSSDSLHSSDKPSISNQTAVSNIISDSASSSLPQHTGNMHVSNISSHTTTY